MAILRAGDIGSIRAWLPSRRSVDSHRGAWVMVALGQVRSGRSIGGKARYRWYGIGLGFCWWLPRCRVMALSQSVGPGPEGTSRLRSEGFRLFPQEGRASLRQRRRRLRRVMTTTLYQAEGPCG